MDTALPDVLALLSRTPGAIRGLMEGLPEAWLLENEGPGTFSARDVLGHLIEGEKTDWVPRIQRILATGEAEPFVPFDRFGFRDRIQDRSTERLLDEFAALRAESLAYLKETSLTSDQLLLTGLHPELGRVTLGQLLATWAVHDLNHVAQIARVMSKRYKEAVGPWKAYLGVLNR